MAHGSVLRAARRNERDPSPSSSAREQSNHVLGLLPDILTFNAKKKKKYSYEVDLTSFHSFIYSSQIIMALLGTVDTKMSKAELFSPENL